MATELRRTSIARLSTDGDNKGVRVVAVRYFLDRPGADLTKASVRIYQNPPAACKASDVKAYLERQNLVPAGSVCEVYLDAFEAFMAVDACDKSGVVFDLEKSTAADPRDIAVRITSPTLTTKEEAKPPRQCNMGPCGLFAFSLLMGLEATWLTYELRPNSGYVHEPFYATWSAYAFFIGGLLQLLVGILEVFRNNVYGATAFMAFGSFWLANGIQMLIRTYFPEEIPDVYTGKDAWGHAIRYFYLAGFVGGLWIQTLKINKATTTLITFLFFKLIFGAFEESVKTCEWIAMVLTWIVSIIAFVLFISELTNEVYGYEVVDLHAWETAEGETNAFAAPGRSGAMVIPQDVLALRAARVKTMRQKSARNK